VSAAWGREPVASARDLPIHQPLVPVARLATRAGRPGPTKIPIALIAGTVLAGTRYGGGPTASRMGFAVARRSGHHLEMRGVAQVDGAVRVEA